MIFFHERLSNGSQHKERKRQEEKSHGHWNQGTQGSLAAFVQSTEFLGFVFECSKNIDIDITQCQASSKSVIASDFQLQQHRGIAWEL